MGRDLRVEGQDIYDFNALGGSISRRNDWIPSGRWSRTYLIQRMQELTQFLADNEHEYAHEEIMEAIAVIALILKSYLPKSLEIDGYKVEEIAKVDVQLQDPFSQYWLQYDIETIREARNGLGVTDTVKDVCELLKMTEEECLIQLGKLLIQLVEIEDSIRAEIESEKENQVKIRYD